MDYYYRQFTDQSELFGLGLFGKKAAQRRQARIETRQAAKTERAKAKAETRTAARTSGNSLLDKVANVASTITGKGQGSVNMAASTFGETGGGAVPPQPQSNKLFIYVGVGIIALILIFFLTKKK